MNSAILLIDIGVIAFLVWGGVLSLVSIALDEAWKSGPGVEGGGITARLRSSHSPELPSELRGNRANSYA